MAGRLSRQLLYELYRTFGRELKSIEASDQQRASLGGAYHKEERKLLYMMVRHFAPDLIVEFSPKRGLTTLHAALALEHNGRGRLLSFELGYRSVRRAYDNVRRNRLGHRVEFFLGDVREELPGILRRLRERTSTTGIEFLFVDSDHGGEFARWYLQALFPYVRRNGVIHIHDIQTDPRNPLANLFFEPSGEEREVRQFLLRNADRYEWLSVADSVRDPAYLDAVRPFGGGDVALESGDDHPALEGVPFEWNPSLWVLKKGDQESHDVVDVEFQPLKRHPLIALKYAFRKRQFAALQRRAR